MPQTPSARRNPALSIVALAALALAAATVGCATQDAPAGDEVGTSTQALAVVDGTAVPVAVVQPAASHRGMVNIAQGRPATQSSVTHGGVPERAVDGNLDGDYTHGSVTATTFEQGAWWRVQLAGMRPITSVTVTSRTDCCSERLLGAVVELLDDQDQVLQTRPLAASGTVPVTQEVLFGGALGSRVRVRLQGADYLFLTEVQVWMAIPDLAGVTPQSSGLCWKQTYGRGAGTVPDTCVGTEKNAGLCYPGCAPGYVGVGPVCWQSCPAGYVDDGAFCRRDAQIFASNNAACPWYDKCGVTLAKGCSVCPPGYANDGCTCRRDAHIFAKHSYGRGVGTVPTACSGGKQLDAGLCYDTCSGPMTGVGPVCWARCGGNYPTECGAMCATSANACVDGLTNQAKTTIEAMQKISSMVIAFGDGGVSVSVAAEVFQDLANDTAKRELEGLLNKTARQYGIALPASDATTISDALVAYLRTGRFDWTVLDPTGIAAVVKAFNQPLCQ